MNIFLLIIYLGLFISVAFVTLLERKIMGYVHLRKGPNKVGLMGIFQPFADAGKLFMKFLLIGFKFMLLPYCFSLFVMVILLLTMWLNLVWFYYDFFWGGLYFFCLISVGVYPLVFAGWGSVSKYSILGSLRAVGQAVSYEISFFFFFLFFFIFLGVLSFEGIVFFQEMLMCGLMGWPLMFIIFILMLAELGRTPFDFIEGESELVSGFNIEYGSGFFAVIFICEYGMIIFMSCLMVMLFVMSKMFFFFNVDFFFRVILISLIFIIVRVEFPRTRYDKLMSLAWEIIFPISFFIVVLSSFLVLIF